MEVRIYDSNRDAELLRVFNEKVFGASSSSSENTAPANPRSYAGPTVIALENGVIVGHLTSTRYDLWCEGQEIPAYWLSGFHVLPGLRGGGVGKKLVACMNEALPVLSAVVVVDASLKAFQANRWIYPGMIKESIHVAKPERLNRLFSPDRIERFLPKPMKKHAQFWARALALPCSVAIKTYKGCFGISGKIASGRKLDFQQVNTFDESVDQLWEKVRNRFVLTHARRADYLNWMFPAEKNWRKAIHSKQGEVRSWVIYAVNDYTHGPLRGFKTLNVIDALWDLEAPDEASNVMNFILSLGNSADVDFILISGADWLGRAARRTAFLPIPPTVHVGFWSGDKTETYTRLFKDSYITRGYADAAGNLGPL